MALHLQSTIAPSILQYMKPPYLLFLALAALLLFSCDSSHIGENERDKIVRRLAEDYYWKAAGNNGYEFVSLKEIDAITFQDNIDFRRQYIQQQIDENERMLAIALQKRDTFPDLTAGKDTTPYYDNKIAEYQGKIDRYQQVLLGIDSLAQSLGDSSKEIASYTYLYTLKANNPQGQQETQRYYIQTDPGYGVLLFTPDSTQLYPNPNDFPGYREMAGRVLGE